MKKIGYKLIFDASINKSVNLFYAIFIRRIALKNKIIMKISSDIMKNLTKKLLSGTALLLTICILSCNGDDDASTVSGNQNVQEVINTVRSGSWKITNYYDTDQDETTDFNGYNFTFGSGNVLTASNGTNNYTGTWSVTNSDSNDDDDSGSSDIDFNIAFSSPEKFQELTDDWDIIEKSATVIKLRDISGGNGGTDYLTFTKN